MALRGEVDLEEGGDLTGTPRRVLDRCNFLPTLDIIGTSGNSETWEGVDFHLTVRRAPRRRSTMRTRCSQATKAHELAPSTSGSKKPKLRTDPASVDPSTSGRSSASNAT